jgi:hypothetical protein
MRITHDKNGDPFGYCEAECGQQLRVGGDRYRVKAFLARFPWAKTAPAPAPAPAPAEPVMVEVKEQTPAPAKPRSAFDDALKILGVVTA